MKGSSIVSCPLLFLPVPAPVLGQQGTLLSSVIQNSPSHSHSRRATSLSARHSERVMVLRSLLW